MTSSDRAPSLHDSAEGLSAAGAWGTGGHHAPPEPPRHGCVTTAQDPGPGDPQGALSPSSGSWWRDRTACGVRRKRCCLDLDGSGESEHGVTQEGDVRPWMAKRPSDNTVQRG